MSKTIKILILIALAVLAANLVTRLSIKKALEQKANSLPSSEIIMTPPLTGPIMTPPTAPPPGQ